MSVCMEYRKSNHVPSEWQATSHHTSHRPSPIPASDLLRHLEEDLSPNLDVHSLTAELPEALLPLILPYLRLESTHEILHEPTCMGRP